MWDRIDESYKFIQQIAVYRSIRFVLADSGGHVSFIGLNNHVEGTGGF